MDLQGSPRSVFFARLILGLAQGLALYLLYSAFDHKVWPASQPQVFAPLVMVALYVPLLVLQGLGNLRPKTLLIWTGTATVLLAGLAFYDVWRAWPGASLTPSAWSYFVCAVILFVAHALVSCGDADRKIVANYPTLFDLAWKLGVQIAIAACFVASFWLMIWLGVALFDMIKLTGFQTFIGHPWVWIPLTTLATAVSIHITDARANLVRGVRTLALTLCGWLLPVITGIAFTFLISLMVTGLQPLWETRSATFLLLAAATVLVIHINAVYQDGNPDQRPHHILRVAGTLAAVLLVFIVAIAAYALWLRVMQYGWTADRITSAACVLIAAMFALGYLVAAILPGLWLKLIERWNVYGTFLFLIVVFALSTPIADPARLSVQDQMARLNAGKATAAQFDFQYLRHVGGRYGRAALQTLESSPNPAVRRAAAEAIIDRPLAVQQMPPATAADRARAIEVFPKGQSLPTSFLEQDWDGVDELRGIPVGMCLLSADPNVHCVAYYEDFNGDGLKDVLLIRERNGADQNWWTGLLFSEVRGRWMVIADVPALMCAGEYENAVHGALKATPQAAPLADLQIGNRRIPLAGKVVPDACP